MKKLVLLVVVCGLVLAGCGAQSESRDTKNMTIEQKFVIVSLNHFVEKDDPQVSRAKELLDRAAKTYRITKDSAADQAYATYKIAQEQDVNISAMDVLDGVTKAYVDGSKIEFSQACNGYLTFRRIGLTHDQASASLIGLVKGFSAKK